LLATITNRKIAFVVGSKRFFSSVFDPTNPGDVESDVGLTVDVVIKLTTSVKQTKPTW